MSNVFPSTGMKRVRRRKLGAVLLGLGSLTLSGPSAVIFAQSPDVTTRTGRLLCAGALANLSLSLVWSAVAFFPLRRGEQWAFWAYLIPIPLYGLPMLVLDATNVVRAHLIPTLAPQVAGLSVAVFGLILVAPGVFGPPSSRTGNRERPPAQ